MAYDDSQLPGQQPVNTQAAANAQASKLGKAPNRVGAQPANGAGNQPYYDLTDWYNTQYNPQDFQATVHAGSAVMPGQNFDSTNNALIAAAQAAAAKKYTEQIKGAQINMTPQDQQRANQNALQAQLAGQAGQLWQQAQGQGGPSVAELLANQQASQADRRALSLANSSRGISPGAALAMAQQQQGQGGIQAQQVAAQVRASEQQRAQQNFMGLQGMRGELASQARGQDIGLAGQQAGLNQQANLSNQQMSMEQQRLDNQMVEYYMSLVAQREMTQEQANMAIEQMRIQNAQFNAAQMNNQWAVGQGAEQQQNSATLGAIGTGIGAGVGAIAGGGAGAVPGAAAGGAIGKAAGGG